MVVRYVRGRRRRIVGVSHDMNLKVFLEFFERCWKGIEVSGEFICVLISGGRGVLYKDGSWIPQRIISRGVI